MILSASYSGRAGGMAMVRGVAMGVREVGGCNHMISRCERRPGFLYSDIFKIKFLIRCAPLDHERADGALFYVCLVLILRMPLLACFSCSACPCENPSEPSRNWRLWTGPPPWAEARLA